MEVGFDTQQDILQSLIKSCLLEINKLKLRLTELQIQKSRENSDEKIIELENHILEKEKELSVIKYKAEEQIAALSTKVQDQESIIKSQENKIYELDYITKSLDEIKEYFAEQLMEYKQNELAEVNDRLNESYRGLAEKDAQISILNKTIDEYKIKLIKLEKDAQNKEEIFMLRQALEAKNRELLLKENEFEVFRKQAITKDEFLDLQQQLSRKNDKIRRLEEINEFFTDLQHESQSFNTPEKIPPFRLDRK